MFGKILSLLFGGSGVASVVANGAKVAALVPIGLYMFEHKDQAAVTLTYGQLALFGALCFVILGVAHAARGPSWSAGPYFGDRPGQGGDARPGLLAALVITCALGLALLLAGPALYRYAGADLPAPPAAASTRR